MLDNRYAILFVRGERPIIDEKLSIFDHPNVGLSTYGGAAPYVHGGTEQAVASITLGVGTGAVPPMPDAENTNLELLSNEEIPTDSNCARMCRQLEATRFHFSFSRYAFLFSVRSEKQAAMTAG